ncbi:MAG: tetraacyldisaccharide 4'-kinase, partial [Bryobacteraceae bacterium]|nr:tetraacyldisaccharide 4'-kinase [Bryobacteraceae bacterium]
DLLRWITAQQVPLWIAASTVAPEFPGDCDEDDAVIRAFHQLRPTHLANTRLILAPRKPERFDIVAGKLKAAGVPFVRRSRLSNDPDNLSAPVLLLDSLGELSATFRYGDAVFMGGTLAHRGGHNILEPAAFGKPVIVGPHLENFAEVQTIFREGRGFVEIADEHELSGSISRVLQGEFEETGRRALQLSDRHRGATARAVAAIVDSRWNAVPRNVNALLQVASWFWIAGGWIKRKLTTPWRISPEVISVGGLSMGGAGKTPVVRELALALQEEGKRVAILTRGYRRKDNTDQVLAAGSRAPVAATGDEAQLYLRDATASLGIGANRAQVALSLMAKLGEPDVFLLDDGFQHARLERNFDIVVLDGLDPFAGGAAFPLGRLREPVSALQRARLIVISRSEGRRYDGVVRMLAEANPAAEIVCTETIPTGFVCVTTGKRESASAWRERRVSAFCGLGNPESFRRTLTSLGVAIERFTAFPDHHDYSPSDIQKLQIPQAVLVTTEKDAVKLEGSEAEIWYLTVRVQIKKGRHPERTAPVSQEELTDYGAI